MVLVVPNIHFIYMYFYIEDFVTSMLFTMSMNVMTILQGIFMMVIHPILYPLIDEWPP